MYIIFVDGVITGESDGGSCADALRNFFGSRLSSVKDREVKVLCDDGHEELFLECDMNRFIKKSPSQ